MFLFLLFFFFSSRRRHTRCLSDWSSDVCSSDLDLTLVTVTSGNAGMGGGGGDMTAMTKGDAGKACHVRSEERRVGKECRSRWERYREKQKKRQEHTRQIKTKERTIDKQQPHNSR